MNINKLLWLISFLIIFNCNDDNQKKESDFTLIDNRTYFTDSFNGIAIYRDGSTKKVMDGYYVVGNELTKWEEFNLEKGILNGDYITYHSNGNIASKGKYVNSKLHGNESTYYLSGKLKSDNQYYKSLRQGKSITYYESGQIKEESNFINNELTESSGYSLIGEISMQMFLKDGRKYKQFIKAGKVFSEQISSTYDNYEAAKLYNEDGSVNRFFRMIDDSSGKFIVELDINEKEIKRINLEKNPQEAMKYLQLFSQ